MKRNVCGSDRAARLVGGTLLAVAAFRGLREREDHVAAWRIVAAYAAAELLVTGLLRWCPGNYLLGIDTCEQDWRDVVRTVRRQS